MSKVLKKVFKTQEKGYEDGKEVTKDVELAIKMPSSIEKQKARLVYARAWREAVESGAIMRQALDRYLKDQKLWDELRQKDYDRLRRQILEGCDKLRMGGNAGLTKGKAKELAFQIADWRDEMTDLLAERNRVESNTADAIAEQAQFNYFVAACTVYNDTGKPYFTANGFDPSYEVYSDKAGDPAGIDAATKFAEIYYNASDDDSVDIFPERKFLKEHGFADEKGRLVNGNGKLVDRQGRLIDENGRFVNENGEFVDVDGKRVDEAGNHIVDFAPFLPEEGEETSQAG